MLQRTPAVASTYSSFAVKCADNSHHKFTKKMNFFTFLLTPALIVQKIVVLLELQ